MFKTIGESVDTATELRSLVSGADHCEVVIAPVFTAIKPVADRLEGSNVSVSGQNCSTEAEHGAHTGEICADMLADAGADYVIVGHSERRQYYGESDSTVNQRAKAGLAHGLQVIACVGESLEERESGRAEDVVGTQLSSGLAGLTVSDMERIIIAYEPVWAIGTGKTASPEQAQEMHGYIRSQLAKSHGDEVAAACRILYGGSVKPANVSDLMSKPDIDGALVGGASLDANSFSQIVGYR